MSRETDAVLIHEHATDWVFLRLADEDLPYHVLDSAEAELHGRDDLAKLKAAAEDTGEGTSRLEIGTVTVTDDGRVDELIVTAEAAA